MQWCDIIFFSPAVEKAQHKKQEGLNGRIIVHARRQGANKDTSTGPVKLPNYLQMTKASASKRIERCVIMDTYR